MSQPGPKPAGLSPESTIPWRRWLGLLQSFVGLTLVVLIFVGYQVFFRSDTTFLSPFRLTLIAKQTAIVGMGALGMTVIIISAGIDLSSGSMVALSAVTLAVALRAGVPPIWSVVLVLAAGIAAGAINGLLITGLRLVPFIVTLGTMLAYRGLAEQIASQNKIPVPNAPDWLAGLLDPPAKGSWQLVATGVWLVIVLGIVIGRLFMALAGIFSFSELNKQGDPGTGVGLELDIIAAVVIGGGSLNGGRGSVLGSIIGALTMTVLRSGCVYAGISDPIQRIVIGAIIVGAVALDQFSQRRGRQV
jgi:ribose transport system permease protein